METRSTDDGDVATFDWLASQAVRCEDEGYWETGRTLSQVWWEAGLLSFTVDGYQSDPGEPTETVATDWQVDGDAMPRALIPRTRGQFRRLVALVNETAKRGG